MYRTNKTYFGVLLSVWNFLIAGHEDTVDQNNYHHK